MTKLELIDQNSNLIIEMYKSGKSLSRISKELSCDRKKLSKYLKSYRIDIKSYKKINEEKIKLIIESYKCGTNISEIALLFGHNQFTISNLLKYNNIEKRSMSKTKQKYYINENYFNNIDTEEKAYWLGFITADGCLHNGAIKINISRKDRSILEKFKKDLNSEHPIKDYKQKGFEYSSFYICNQKIYSSLLSCGLYTHKSLSIKPSDKVTQKFEIPFIRGLFDGDGGISYIKKTKNYRIDFCGSYDIVKYFEHFVISNINTKARVRKYRNIYYISYGGINLIQTILKLLYNNATIYLDRKKELADKILIIEPKFSRI